MLDNEGDVYLIDFGLSFLLDIKTPKKFSGTHIFSSSSSLKGDIPSFWDDVESLFYILVHIFFGAKGVPWEYTNKIPRIYVNDYAEYAKIRDSYIYESLILNTKLPPYLKNFYNSINRTKDIDYDILITFFTSE